VSVVPVPDAWQSTAHPYIELRPAYGVVPVSGRRPTIVGWRVRVWREVDYAADPVGVERCPMCEKTCAMKANGDPSKHRCAVPVPWINRSWRDGAGYLEPHTHPIRRPPISSGFLRTGSDPGEEHADMRAEPVLYSTRQGAYAAGLRLLGAEGPMSWMPGGER
jgi:hypothetical protein